MNHEAIRLVYPNAQIIDDTAGVFDFDGEPIIVDQAIVDSKIAELKVAEPMRLLRLERNILLSKTDWMANSDVTMTNDWKNYRKNLRDLPANSPNVALDADGNLAEVNWPTTPE